MNSAIQAKELATRFEGTAGARLLRDALLKQPLVQGDEKVADLLTVSVRIMPYGQEDEIIRQGASDTGIYGLHPVPKTPS